MNANIPIHHSRRHNPLSGAANGALGQDTVIAVADWTMEIIADESRYVGGFWSTVSGPR
jgi:hypothetical protein